MYQWFGLLHTIVIFCKIVKTGVAYAKSFFFGRTLTPELKKIMTSTLALG